MIKSDELVSPIIKVDYREGRSGIPDLLKTGDALILITNLSSGDYIINDHILIERKTSNDFIQSLISGRLFSQCSALKKSSLQPLILIEGDLYHTNHRIENHAVKGALLSIAVSWEIALIYSQNPEESADLILLLSNQEAKKEGHWVRSYGYKPKRLKNRRIRFLQGLPNTGTEIANNLLNHFGNIESIINADISKLQEVPHIGRKIAERIRKFVSEKEEFRK